MHVFFYNTQLETTCILSLSQRMFLFRLSNSFPELSQLSNKLTFLQTNNSETREQYRLNSRPLLNSIKIESPVYQKMLPSRLLALCDLCDFDVLPRTAEFLRCASSSTTKDEYPLSLSIYLSLSLSNKLTTKQLQKKRSNNTVSTRAPKTLSKLPLLCFKAMLASRWLACSVRLRCSSFQEMRRCFPDARLIYCNNQLETATTSRLWKPRGMHYTSVRLWREPRRKKSTTRPWKPSPHSRLDTCPPLGLYGNATCPVPQKISVRPLNSTPPPSTYISVSHIYRTLNFEYLLNPHMVVNSMGHVNGDSAFPRGCRRTQIERVLRK